MLSGFGRSWVTDSIAFKIYPGCAYIDTTMDALFRALEDIENVRGRRLKPEEVESVRVEASILTVGMDNISKEFLNKERLEAININFSIPFNVAIGIIAGRLTPSELKQEELDKNSHIIKSLASRVILKHNPSMTFRAIDSFINSGLIYKAIKKIGFTKLYQLRKKLKENIPEKAGLKIMEILPIMTLMRKIPEMWWKKNAFAISFDNFKLLFPASVIIRLNDGSEFYSSSEWPLGSNSDSEQIQRVERKFFEEGKRAGIKDIDKLFSLINNIEKRS
jgi:2-methylcitrate dehydratase PrpD